MTIPWLDLAVLSPLVGAVAAARSRHPERAHEHGLIHCALALAFCALAWRDAALAGAPPFELFSFLAGTELFGLDEWNAPLASVVALIYLLTVLATLKAKARRFSFFWTMVSEFLLLLTFACKQPGLLVILLLAGTVPRWIELRSRGQSTRAYTIYTALFAGLLIAGALGQQETAGASGIADWLLAAAIMVRAGALPMHGWLIDFFDRSSFGTALLHTTPMVGALAAVRLLFPVASDTLLRCMEIGAMATTVYAACLAIVETDARRFFCYLLLSHSSLVFVGLGTATTTTLTGALWLWLSVGLSLTGFGLVLRSIEARAGRLRLDRYHGLYEHTPELAALFLLTGLASVGFPGTIGFVGTELLVDGTLTVKPLFGLGTVVASAFNGIAVVRAYFRLFTGARYSSSIDLACRLPERLAMLVLAGLVLLVGVMPQTLATSCSRAASGLSALRAAGDPAPTHPGAHQRAAPAVSPEHTSAGLSH